MQVVYLVHVHFLVLVVVNLLLRWFWNIHRHSLSVAVPELILLHDGFDLLAKLLLVNTHDLVRQVCVYL